MVHFSVMMNKSILDGRNQTCEMEIGKIYWVQMEILHFRTHTKVFMDTYHKIIR